MQGPVISYSCLSPSDIKKSPASPERALFVCLGRDSHGRSAQHRNTCVRRVTVGWRRHLRLTDRGGGPLSEETRRTKSSVGEHDFNSGACMHGVILRLQSSDVLRDPCVCLFLTLHQRVHCVILRQQANGATVVLLLLRLASVRAPRDTETLSQRHACCCFSVVLKKNGRYDTETTNRCVF